MMAAAMDKIGYRYNLLRTAQGVLAKAGATWKEQHRTCWCSRSLLYGDYGDGTQGKVDFYRNEARTNSSMRGLQRCGNLHTCPVCSAKAGELRRKQLSAAMVKHVAKGGTTAYLLTQTFPHERCAHGEGEKCEYCLDVLQEKFSKARARFQNSRQWKAFRKAKGVIGCCNSFEHTVSLENGWHPHVHMLIFCNKQAFDEGAPADNGDLNSPAIEALCKLWCKILLDCGLGDQKKLADMKRHALNVRGGEKAAEYIAKFGHDERCGMSAELAKSHAKIGSVGFKWGDIHFTPFQLLLWAEQGDGWAVHRFRDYAKAIEGKRALTWSPDLKRTLGVLDVDEEEWAKDDNNQPEQIYVGYLVAEQYAAIMARKKLPDFLEYVATCACTQDDLSDYVDSLRDEAPVASGAILVKRKEGRAVAFTT
jgi:hypothetical protein